MQDAFYASNSCRTCRQKRVKCDRLLPACLRCSALKLRCHGYERPRKLVWTNSVASRGKMMGKATFSTTEVPKETLLSRPALQPFRADQSDSAEPTQDACTSSCAVTMSLTDTSLQDLSPECRKFLRYFDLDLSRQSVVYDQPSTNPFLALMPLISKSQALSHAMVSISAFHYTYRMVISYSNPSSRDGRNAAAQTTKSWHLSNGHSWQMSQPTIRDSLRAALSNKQKALEYLKAEVWDEPAKNSDATVAAIVLFICMDVVEFGSHGWNHHLRGAAEMVRGRIVHLQTGEPESAPWLKYFDTACTTFSILGATLAPNCTLSTPRSPLLEPASLHVLRRSESQTWVGCPAELLYLLSSINSLRESPRTASEALGAIPDLCNDLFNFSPLGWAEEFPEQQHHEARSHLAYAYKAAVEVYASHVIGSLPSQHYLSKYYILDISRPAILRMLAISPEDFHIKSLVWPAFVLGAEAKSLELRELVRTVFYRIWISSCCYNAMNAMKILDMVWARDFNEDSEKCGLDYIWQLEDSWLFV